MDDQQIDPQFAQEVQIEVQKAKIQQQLNKQTEMCWDICVGSMVAKFDGRTESCITNCVDRYVDTGLLIQNRFQEKLSMAGRLG
ncbi:mitochondrial import inner membrane translocase subunit Tim8-like [Saccostrea echinata]|uniref:mitochondrial import inner membrane translocase subunit Tim8-like n=1 Tax=Saccostrea echinata TaxID=191078 RepID=UPI002A7F46D3|nr:mitochondrial import inner membrane translocase subunit Tim8-like [Saccostrea echinata]